MGWVVDTVQLVFWLALTGVAVGVPLGAGMILGVRMFFGESLFYAELRALLTTKVSRERVKRER